MLTRCCMNGSKPKPKPKPSSGNIGKVKEEEKVEQEKEEEEECDRSCDCTNINFNANDIPYLWYPTLQSVKQIEYVRKLECEYACLQKAYLSLTTQFARMQFRLRQIIIASPSEREALLFDLEKFAFEGGDGESCDDELPRIQRDLRCMGDVRRKQADILENLRSHLTALAEASEIEGIEYEPGFNSDDYGYSDTSYVPQTRRSSSRSSKSIKSNTTPSSETLQASPATTTRTPPTPQTPEPKLPPTPRSSRTRFKSSKTQMKPSKTYIKPTKMQFKSSRIKSGSRSPSEIRCCWSKTNKE